MKRTVILVLLAALAVGAAESTSAEDNRTIEVKQIVTHRDDALRGSKKPGPSYLAKPVNRFDAGEKRDDPDVIYLPKKGWAYGTE